MPYCRNCGSRMPEDAVFCPSCGASTEVKTQFAPDVKEIAQRYIVLGLIGAFLSVMVSAFSSINLYFIPSFVASIFIIYVYRLNDLSESLIASLIVYIFAEGVLGTLVLGQYYSMNQSLTFIPEIWDVILYPLSPISALIAAYIGVRISPKRRERHAFSSRRREEGPGGVIYSL